MRRALALLCLATLAGCGSTVQVSGQALGTDPSGFGLPGATASGAAVPGAGTSVHLPIHPAGPTAGGVGPAMPPAVLARGLSHLPPGAPVTVGIRIPNRNAGAVVGNLTGSSLDTGDPKAMATAVVRWVNAHGGLAGHRVDPVFYENCAPLACDLAVQDQNVCATFTQDHKAVAMVDATETSVALASCLARAGTASFGGGAAAFDTQDFQAAQGLWTPYLLALDDAYRQLVQRLDAMRWFVTGENVGLLVVDTPTFRRVATVTKQAMAASGHSFADEATWSGNSNDMSGIVLQFKAHQVKRIVVVETGSQALLQFGPAASAQGYYPKVTVTSSDVIGTLALIESPRTLDGAAGIGWLPAADATPKAPAPTATARLCARIYRDASVSTSGPLAAAFAATYCDGLLFARAAYARASDLSLMGLRVAVPGLSYIPAATFADRFAPGRYAGAAVTRDVRYDTSCRCFRYTSGEVRVV